MRAPRAEPSPHPRLSLTHLLTHYVGELCHHRAQVITDGSGNIKLKSTTADKEFAPEEISAQVLRKLCGDAGSFLGADVKKVRHHASSSPPSHCLGLEFRPRDAGVCRRRDEAWLFRLELYGDHCMAQHQKKRKLRYSTGRCPVSPHAYCSHSAGMLRQKRCASRSLERLTGARRVWCVCVCGANESMMQAVITVPAYFNDSQRQATKDAGRIAGLEVLRIINEPTAASLAYGFEKKSNETILVFDLGGGTFDVSVLEVGDGVFEVLSTCGDTFLGGDDFDKRIVDHLADQFKKDEGIDLRGDKQALQRLTEAAEKAKMELSTITQASVNLPFITATAEGPKHIDTMITRAAFEKMSADLIDRCRVPVETALKDAKISLSDVSEVILVGGSTRIPAVSELVAKMTKKAPNVTVNPDEVVALGAAVQAGVLAGEVSDIVLLDVTPLSLGLETLGGVMTKLISRNTTLPTSKSEVFSTAADGQSSVEINVLQGEREFVKDNKSLGNFRLDGIPPAPRGVPQIEVTFDIDANGILSVTAKDKGTGKSTDIKITGASTLSDDEVSRMVNDAEKFAEEDKEKREAVDTKNSADSMAYQTAKQLEELGDKVPEDTKASVNEKLDALKAAIAADDTAQMKAAMETLQEAVMAMGQAVYSQAGAQGADPAAGGPPPPEGGAKPDDVIDADFTDSKPEDKK
jgi:heat shock protein 1/8